MYSKVLEGGALIVYGCASDFNMYWCKSAEMYFFTVGVQLPISPEEFHIGLKTPELVYTPIIPILFLVMIDRH